jgi:hypothetical protein
MQLASISEVLNSKKSPLPRPKNKRPFPSLEKAFFNFSRNVVVAHFKFNGALGGRR